MKIRWQFALGMALLSALLAARVSAQTASTPWTAPVNLSQSGGTLQPLIAIAADGTQHALWWDQTDGERYARGSITDPTWSKPINVPAIFGLRKLDTVTGRETIVPPRSPRLMALDSEAVAVWIDSKDQLNSAQSKAATWSDATTLSASALMFDVAHSLSSTLELAYINPVDSAEELAGIYYRTYTGQTWSDATLVYRSLYFRTAAVQDLQLSATRVGQNVLVAWDDPQLSQSLYARSEDGGRTWNEPQTITSTPGGRARRAYVTTAPNGDIVLMWQDPNLQGCGWLQRQSSDGGATWSEPQRVLSNLTRCDEHLTFSIANGQLWLVGRAIAANTSAQAATTLNVITLAMWDGRAWLDPLNVSLSFLDTTTSRTVTLNCLDVSLSGQTAGLIGCDSIGDVWSARNARALKDLSAALKPVWSPVEAISDRTSPVAGEGILATTTDRQGNIYAMWSQTARGSAVSTALYGSELINNRWARPGMLLYTPDESNTGNEIHLGQPVLVTDNHDRIHVVWNNGTTGSVYYAWAYARDFNIANSWSAPVTVPQTTSTTSWPDVAIGPDDDTVYVIYAAPFNENRGIYFTRSNDNGTTWWLTPTLVFDAVGAHWDSVDKPRLVFDPGTNVLHAIWLRANLPGSLSPRGIYYARSTDGGQTWSQPLALTAGQVDWPRLVLNGSGELVAAWTELTAQGQSDTITPWSVASAASNDGGMQWSAPIQVPSFGHVSGPIDLASNHSGTSYLGAVGQTANGESQLMYSEWTPQGWGQAENSALSQNAMPGNSPAIALAPEVGQLTMLIRLWVFDSQNRGVFQITATGRKVQAVAITAAPTVAPQITTTPPPTDTPQPTATPRPELPDNTQLPKTAQRGLNPLIMGGVLAALIVVAVGVRTIWVKRH